MIAKSGNGFDLYLFLSAFALPCDSQVSVIITLAIITLLIIPSTWLTADRRRTRPKTGTACR